MKDIEQYVIDAITNKLEEAEEALSDAAYAFLASQEGIENLLVYRNALVAYSMTIEARYYMEDEDEQDAETIRLMLKLINSLLSIYFDLEDDDLIIIEP